jgi:hypothetical protein
MQVRLHVGILITPFGEPIDIYTTEKKYSDSFLLALKNGILITYSSTCHR